MRLDCRNHDHPKLRVPVSRAQVERDLRKAWRRARLPGRYQVAWTEALARTHERDWRRYAQVGIGPGMSPRFELAPQFVWLPARYRHGVLAHEVGHVLSPHIDSEEAADVSYWETTGKRLAYDRRFPGKGLQFMKNPPPIKWGRARPAGSGGRPALGVFWTAETPSKCGRFVIGKVERDGGLVHALFDRGEVVAHGKQRELKQVAAERAATLGNPYYHGASTASGIGREILPPAVTGHQTEPRVQRRGRVFFTTDPESARTYARRAVRARGGEPAVYEVAPHGPVKQLSRRGPPFGPVFHAERAEVVARRENPEPLVLPGGCGRPGCGAAAAACGRVAFGSGVLDQRTGYWEHPCASCARAYVDKYGLQDADVWPSQAKENPKPKWIKVKRQAVDDGDLNTVFVAHDTRTRPATPAGRIELYSVDDSRVGVNWVFVEDDYLRQGVATALYGTAARWLHKQGRQLVSGSVRSWQADAFWSKQHKKGRATHTVEDYPWEDVATTRYELAYPPPRTLYNPPQQLSHAQQAVLKTIRERFAKAVQDEEVRWGPDSAAAVAAKGVDVSDLARRTVLALERKGAIRVTRFTGSAETLRRGPYGRWAGGTNRHEYVALYAAPAIV